MRTLYWLLSLLSRFLAVPELNRSAELLAEELSSSTYPPYGIGIPPTANLLYFPWSWTVFNDNKVPGPERRAGNQSNPSLITLTPAPGEVFDLNLTSRGQFMESSDVLAYLKVPKILLQAAQ